MDLLTSLGLRWLRRAAPMLFLAVFLAVMANDTSRAWLIDRAVDRGQRRAERILDRMPQPTIPATEPSAAG
jgi:hypothetical protein